MNNDNLQIKAPCSINELKGPLSKHPRVEKVGEEKVVRLASILRSSDTQSLQCSNKLLAETQEYCSTALHLLQKWQPFAHEIAPIQNTVEQILKTVKNTDVRSLKSQRQAIEKHLATAHAIMISKTLQLCRQELEEIAPIFHKSLPTTSMPILPGSPTLMDRMGLMGSLASYQGQNPNTEQMKGIIAFTSNTELLRQEGTARARFIAAQNALLQTVPLDTAIKERSEACCHAKDGLEAVWKAIAERYPALKIPHPTTHAPAAPPARILTPTNEPRRSWVLTLLEIFGKKAPPLSCKKLYAALAGSKPDPRGSFEKVAEKLSVKYPSALRQFFSEALASFIQTVYERQDNEAYIDELGLTEEETELIVTAFCDFGSPGSRHQLQQTIDHFFFVNPDWAMDHLVVDFISYTLLKATEDVASSFNALKNIDKYALRGSFAISAEKIPDSAIPVDEGVHAFNLLEPEDVQDLLKGSGKVLSAPDIHKLQNLQNALEPISDHLYAQWERCAPMIGIMLEEKSDQHLSRLAQLVIDEYTKLFQLFRDTEKPLREFRQELRRMLTT